MAQIITYPKLSTLANNDLLLVSDVSSVNKTTNSLEVDTLAQHIIVTNNVITGGGTVRQIPMFTPTGVIIGDSIMRQSTGGGEIQIGGDLNVTGSAVIDNDLTADRGSILNDLSVGNDLSVTGITETNTLIVNLTSEVNGEATFYDNILLDSGVRDNGGSFGTAGQVLSSTGSGVQWTSDGGGTVTGTGTTQTLPIWSDGPAGVLGDSIVFYDQLVPALLVNLPITQYSFGENSFKTTGATGGFDFKSKAFNGGFYRSGNFRFENKLAVGRTNDPTGATLDVGLPSDTDPAAWFRNGVVISNNPSGVQVDNTSMVIGAGNNDNVTGSDHCLIVGSGNQITSNSDQSVAFGQGNTVTSSTDACAIGNSNTITSSLRTLALGYDNNVDSASSFISGGQNTVTNGTTNLVVGYSNTVTLNKNFVVGELLNSSGDTMVLGYRNYTTGYPTPNKNLGLGETKFVIAVGSSTNNIADNNAIIITEGGVNGGSSGTVPQVPRVILPSVPTFSASTDAAADAIGVPEGGLYQNNGVVQINRGGGSTTDPLAGGVTFDYTDSGTNLIIGENLTIATVGNVGLGDGVLQNHTGNGFNTAIGYQSLQYSIAGSSLGKNTALGYRALQGVSGVTSGFNNTAVGFRAGESIENGFQNVFIGNAAGDTVTDGPLNVVIGDSAGGAITTHDSNVIIGQLAGSGLQGSRNVIIGKSAYGGVSGTGDNNIVIGTGAQPSSTSVSDEITIGAAGHNNVRLGGSLPKYADDAAAGVGGLLANMLYQTNGAGAAPLNVAGIVMIKQ